MRGTGKKSKTLSSKPIKSVEVDYVGADFIRFLDAYHYTVATNIDTILGHIVDPTRCKASFSSQYWTETAMKHAERFTAKFPKITGEKYLDSDWNRCTMPVSVLKINSDDIIHHETFEYTNLITPTRGNYILKTNLPLMKCAEADECKLLIQDSSFMWATCVQDFDANSHSCMINVTDSTSKINLYLYSH